jgi:hypothetical protein
MMKRGFLDGTDLRQLTGAARAKAQAAWLAAREVPHKLEDGRVIVLWMHVTAWLEGRPVVSSNGPDWSKVA